jgi:diketogulonate reductase-like aldo/keto reductase
VRNLDVSKVVRTALSVGCRLIDTAASYCNEAEIGAVLRDEGSLKGDCAVPREQIFLTSKVRPQDAGFDRTLNAFSASLDRLGVDYLDLYLIHWPGSAKLPPTSPAHKENRLGSWVTNAGFILLSPSMCAT